jgi:hypothetical protein
MLDFQRRADQQKEPAVQLSMWVCHRMGYPKDPPSKYYSNYFVGIYLRQTQETIWKSALHHSFYHLQLFSLQHISEVSGANYTFFRGLT